MKLPSDLKTYCRKKIAMRVIPCAVLVILFAILLLFWGEIIFDVDRMPVRAICYAGVMLLPFLITGVPLKLIDRTYYGRVSKVDVVTTTDNASSVKPSLELMYQKNTVYLTIEMPDGKIRRKKVYSEKARTQNEIERYRVGDTVFHLWGTSQTVVLPKNEKDPVFCMICGHDNRKNGENCRECGHSLIKHI